MPILKKKDVELSITPEEAAHLTPAAMENLLLVFDRLQTVEHLKPVTPLVTPPAAPLPQVPQGHAAQAARRLVVPRVTIEGGDKTEYQWRLVKPIEFPPDAGPQTKARMMLEARTRGHQRVDRFLINHEPKGALTSQILAGTSISQSEVSRALSGLRKIEELAGLPKESLLIERQESRASRWLAGPSLFELYMQLPEVTP